MAKKPLLVHLDPDLFDWLRAEAADQDLSLSEVVRQALRAWLQRAPESGE
ncbi:MAG: ribbon-helix-helix domain-containing protein [Chloroflexota bacterium]